MRYRIYKKIFFLGQSEKKLDEEILIEYSGVNRLLGTSIIQKARAIKEGNDSVR